MNWLRNWWSSDVDSLSEWFMELGAGRKLDEWGWCTELGEGEKTLWLRPKGHNIPCTVPYFRPGPIDSADWALVKNSALNREEGAIWDTKLRRLIKQEIPLPHLSSVQTHKQAPSHLPPSPETNPSWQIPPQSLQSPNKWKGEKKVNGGNGERRWMEEEGEAYTWSYSDMLFSLFWTLHLKLFRHIIQSVLKLLLFF